jgi:hypothetical protein
MKRPSPSRVPVFTREFPNESFLAKDSGRLFVTAYNVNACDDGSSAVSCA